VVYEWRHCSKERKRRGPRVWKRFRASDPRRKGCTLWERRQRVHNQIRANPAPMASLAMHSPFLGSWCCGALVHRCHPPHTHSAYLPPGNPKFAIGIGCGPLSRPASTSPEMRLEEILWAMVAGRRAAWQPSSLLSFRLPPPKARCLCGSSKPSFPTPTHSLPGASMGSVRAVAAPRQVKLVWSLRYTMLGLGRG
jgi:hypothetical protein